MSCSDFEVEKASFIRIYKHTIQNVSYTSVLTHIVKRLHQVWPILHKQVPHSWNQRHSSYELSQIISNVWPGTESLNLRISCSASIIALNRIGCRSVFAIYFALRPKLEVEVKMVVSWPTVLTESGSTRHKGFYDNRALKVHISLVLWNDHCWHMSSISQRLWHSWWFLVRSMQSFALNVHCVWLRVWHSEIESFEVDYSVLPSDKTHHCGG